MMINLLLLVPIFISLFLTLLITPYWIRKARQIGLVWPDMNKLNSEKTKVSGSGGIGVLVAFIASVLIYISYITFFLNVTDHLIEIFALLSVIVLLGGIGFIDDLLGWQRGGLSRRSRLLLVALSSIPLVAINAGKHTIGLPLVGTVDLGLIYPLFLIPIAIMGASTTFNFLAGFNGLEAGQGILLLGALSITAYITGNAWIAVLGLCMIAALAGFLLYNFNPARVFPGDVMTYPVGGLIAMMAIVGNFEKIAVFFFIPVIIEVVLKSRGKLIKQSFGLPNKDGSLGLRYPHLYSLNHVAMALMIKMNIKPTETKVVLSIWAFQLFIIIIGFILFMPR